MTTNPKSAGKALTELLQGFDAAQAIPNINIFDIASSSRQVAPGSLFVALQGGTTHGIDFAIDAVKAGAVAVMYCAQDDYSEKRIALLSKQAETQWIGIDNLVQVVGEVVSRFYGEPSKAMTIIGVTGTDGKTSVTHLVTQALTRLSKNTASIGTIGYGVGNVRQPTTHTTPDAITLQSYLHEFREQQCEYVVMEVSSHALDQYRVDGCNFDIAVLTNLGRDHLDYHDTRHAYAAAKARLFSEFELSGKVLNVDDEFGHSLCDQSETSALIRFSARPQSSGSSNEQGCATIDAEVRLIKSDITDRGLCMQVASPVGEILANTALMGRFNIENTLACISTLIALGFDQAQIQLAVTDLQSIPGRMEKFIGASDQPAVVVDFAHTEQALRACLTTCREYTTGKVWCVFGCGGDRDQGKRKGMGQAAEQLADRIIITDDNPRTESPEQIVQEILLGLSNPKKASVVHSRLAAIELALSEADADDLVVIAGKGHESEQIVGFERYPFSDRLVVQRILRIAK
ncbi:MAG: UDP-N-acetylmuramoyl-L-alanyl-D-glutamate--2,6-diaminopimelate ligase [Polaribacter sp.]|jgi:UDP-N-acetylmuramoyl-L-alanyl-D-glutamate--2,6-diaminopimelate ligase